MTDKEKKLLKGRVNTLLKEWIFKLIPLRDWQIVAVFSDDKEATPFGYEAGAFADAVWYYRRATITFIMPSIFDLQDLELESLVVHELCHLLVNEMREWGNESATKVRHEEHVVTGLAMALLQTKYDQV